MDKNVILQKMFGTKVVPLFYHGDKEIARRLVDACAAGGAEVIEFTNRGDQAKEVFTDLVVYAEQHHPQLAMGVGSIATPEQAHTFIDIGAHFLVSPFIDEDIFRACEERDIFWTGGCATLTEMHTADKWGVPLMKAFPGNILGPGFIKAAKAPCPWLKIMPTGGVEPTEVNLRTWFESGASCVGMGSRLFVKDSSGAYDYQRISELLMDSIRIANS